MKTLAIDIETYSSIDLKKSGVYRYTEAPDFEILMAAVSVDGCEVEVVADFSDSWLISALADPRILKTAWNANFERTCLSAYFGIELPPEQWECTMVKTAMLGLPLSLEQASNVLRLPQQKDTAGKALIAYFSKPCKPTKANGMRARNLPEHDAEKFEKFKAYCAQDVRTELAIRKKISFFEIPAQEKALWCLDQRINDAGVRVDMQLVDNAIRMSQEYNAKLVNEALQITNLDNPNSATQLKTWLTDGIGKEIESLKKQDIPEIMNQTADENILRMLKIRQELSKTSVKKYASLKHGVCKDSYVRGLLQYYGANRTGRWAGRLVQVQNLPQNKLVDLDLARQIVKSGDLDLFEMLFGNVPDTLSQLIRTAFVASEGCVFWPADFSAIEARVIAWVSGEKWRLDVFATHGKIYEASASQMFKVPIETVTKGSPLRQKGKVSELALGYQGGINALIQMGALREGLTEDELPEIVRMWRQASPSVVRLWKVLETAAIKAVLERTPVRVMHGIEFSVSRGILFVKLPSGRSLAYANPRIKPGKFGGDCITYEGLDQTTKQWKPQDTYGGKLAENIVQAIARDCLAESLLRLEASGYRVAMHVHDEAVIDVPWEYGSMEDVNRIMGEPIPWAPGLILTADCYETFYYKKD